MMEKNMKTTALSIKAIISIAAACALSACCAFNNDDCGWEPLFKQDLSNAQFDKGVWSVNKDGELVATEDKMIFSTVDYENFEISLDFKIQKDANSGIVFYCTDTAKWIPNSLEIQICDSDSEKYKPRGETWLCGAFFGHKAPTTLTATKPVGEWNSMKARFAGKQIDVWINGIHVNSFNLADWKDKTTNPDGSKIPAWLTAKIKSEVPTVGKVGLQGKHGGAACDFRNVKVRKIQK